MAYKSKYINSLFQKDPIATRKLLAGYCRKYRSNHRAANRDYISNYFKEWLHVPSNRKAHKCRTILSSIKHTLTKGQANLGKRNAKILDNLYAIGWNENMSFRVLNHIVSLKLIFDFNIEVPIEVAFDINNLEMVSPNKNNGLECRIVSKKIIETAKLLEDKYPEYLSGFELYVECKEGVLI